MTVLMGSSIKQLLAAAIDQQREISVTTMGGRTYRAIPISGDDYWLNLGRANDAGQKGVTDSIAVLRIESISYVLPS